jgi:hypothetical protein
MNIVLMMAANLVGFVIGTDGIRFFVDELFGTSQGLSLLVIYARHWSCSAVRAPVFRGRMLLSVCRSPTHV